MRYSHINIAAPASVICPHCNSSIPTGDSEQRLVLEYPERGKSACVRNIDHEVIYISEITSIDGELVRLMAPLGKGQ